MNGPAGAGGTFATAATANLQRDDVAAARPGAGVHHGFALSVGGLPAGARSIYVYAINAAGGGNNVLIGSASVTISATAAGTPIGNFENANGGVRGTFRVSGWTLDPDARTEATAVHVYLDGPAGVGRLLGSATANRSRPDVNETFPGAGDQHGFDAGFDGLAAGTTHTAYVYAINRAGGGENPLLKTMTFSVPGPSALVGVDGLTAQSPGYVAITGWVLDPDAPDRQAAVHVYIDDKLYAAIPAELTRPDVQQVFGLDTGPASGFSRALGPLAPGSHKVQIFGINASGTPGTNNLVHESTVDVPGAIGGTPEGSFDVAEPGAEGTKGAIHLRGWTIDPDDRTAATDVHVYIDGPAGLGKLVGSGRADIVREDVATARPGAGPAHGFDIAVTDLPQGTRHAFYVYAINRTGAGHNPLLGSKITTQPGPPAPAPPTSSDAGDGSSVMPNVHQTTTPTAPGTSTSVTTSMSKTKRVTLRLGSSRLPKGTTVRVSGTGVTVRKMQHLGQGRYRLTIRITPSAKAGRRDVLLLRGGRTVRVLRRALAVAH